MVDRASICVRRLAGGRRSAIVGFWRFLANPRVTVEALLAGWGAELCETCADRHVLAIQDTSEINFTTTKQRNRGLGEIGKGGGRGVLLHAMLGLDAETGAVLGLASGRVWTRDGRVTVHHKDRPLSEKESERWLATAQAAKPILLNTRQAGPAIEGALRQTGLECLAVDTHGYTHFASGIAKALGFDLCARPSGLADRKLYLPRGFAVPEALTKVCRATIAPATINRGYDGFLRVAASLHHGWCSATWLLERFGSAAKGDPVFETGSAIGALTRTVHLCNYLSNEPFRRTIHALLAQGEAVHTLQRAIHNGPFGATQGRSGEELDSISAALSLLTNLVIFWNARQMDAIVSQAPDQYPTEHLSRIAPIAHAPINMRGTLRFNLQPHRNVLLDQPSIWPKLVSEPALI